MHVSALDHYLLLGRSGLRVSPFALGGAAFGEEWGWGTHKKESQRIFDAYVDRGGNFIDTSNVYNEGTSETWLGEFMRSKRDRIVVSTKYSNSLDRADANAGGNHRKSIVRAVEGSLKRLQTDYIDVYMLHAWEYRTPVEEIMRAQDDLVRAGKILYLGVSNAPAWIIAQAQCLADRYGWAPIINIQAEYNLVERTAELELLPMACAMGIGVSPWSPTAGGLLTGKYGREDMRAAALKPGEAPSRGDFVRSRLDERSLRIAAMVVEIADEMGCKPAHIALRWLIEQQGVCSPILGCRTAAQLIENLDCLSISLSDDQLLKLGVESEPVKIVPYNTIQGEIVPMQITGGLKVDHSPNPNGACQ